MRLLPSVCLVATLAHSAPVLGQQAIGRSYALAAERIESKIGYWAECKTHLNTDGTLHGEIRVWSNNELCGIAGLVVIDMYDAANNLVARLTSPSVGVNGRLIPGPSDRTKRFIITVPAEIASKVIRVHMYSRETDGPPIPEQIHGVTQAATAFAELGGVLTKVFK